MPTSSNDSPGNMLISAPNSCNSRSSCVQQPDGASFRFVRPLPLEDRHYNSSHLFAGSASELLINARSAYLRAIDWPGLGPDFWLIIRTLTIEYVSEAFAGEELCCGVRTISRTVKTVEVELAVWERTSLRMVLRGTITDVGFDPRARRSRSVPADLWEAIERFEDVTLNSAATVAAGEEGAICSPTRASDAMERRTGSDHD